MWSNRSMYPLWGYSNQSDARFAWFMWFNLYSLCICWTNLSHYSFINKYHVKLWFHLHNSIRYHGAPAITNCVLSLNGQRPDSISLLSKFYQMAESEFCFNDSVEWQCEVLVCDLIIIFSAVSTRCQPQSTPLLCQQRNLENQKILLYDCFNLIWGGKNISFQNTAIHEHTLQYLYCP